MKCNETERTLINKGNKCVAQSVAIYKIQKNNDRSLDGLDREVGRLLSEHPDWCGNENLNRLFLVYTPEAGYSTDDEHSPYYVVKRRLLEAGIPCQMVDTGTLHNPDWKGLNLSLNIIAKCGVTPWVLPENIPDADFFVGLSYTQSDEQKILGFANVFSRCGKWEFYARNTTAFPQIETLATTHPEQAKELIKEFLKVWTSNHDPNAEKNMGRNSWIYFYGFEQRADSIPLTRSKQERNLVDLSEWVDRIRKLELGDVEVMLAKAFTACHSSAEVYRTEDT